jgi:hypothetical protein
MSLAKERATPQSFSASLASQGEGTTLTSS